MKSLIFFVVMLGLLLPAIVDSAQDSTTFHHGSFSCKLKGSTKDGSSFDIVISYQENRRGEITSASVFRGKVPWYLKASWSWFAYEVNIEVKQYSERYKKRCKASARY